MDMMSNKFKEDDKVYVLWRDSGTHDSGPWGTSREIMGRLKIGTVETVGILMTQDEEVLYVALSADKEHDHYFGVQAIWKQDILEIASLRYQDGGEGEGLQEQRGGEGVRETDPFLRGVDPYKDPLDSWR